MSNEITGNHTEETDTLVRTLSAAANRIEPASDWDRLLTDITKDEDRESVKPVFKRPRILAAAATLVVIGAGGAALSAMVDPSPTEISTTKPNYVLPGEIVLSEDPLTVLGALGPEPKFDTSELGREIAFEPAQEIGDEPARTISRWRESFFLSESAEVTKIVSLGTMEDEHWFVAITDEPNSDGDYGASVDANIRTRFLIGPHGGGGSQRMVPVDSLELIAQAAVDREGSPLLGSFSAPTGWVQLDSIPAATSVVSFADSDQRLWMRPTSGVAIFQAQFDDGESFTVQALDADGEVIDSWSETVRYAADAETTNPHVGESFGTIKGVDESGEALGIVPNGKPTILVYGAEWCIPCSQVIENALPALELLNGTANVYSVPHYVMDNAPWPVDDAWPYPMLHPDRSSPARNVGLLPTVLVLDGEHNVVALLDGFDDLAERLEALGIAPSP